MAEELNGCGHNVVARNRKKGGLRVHRNVYVCERSELLIRQVYQFELGCIKKFAH